MTFYYRNEYLFSEIYLQEITQQTEKEDVLASLETIKEYRDWADTSDIQVWKDSFVHEVLYALRFGVKGESDHVTLLYPMGTLEHPISVCYILLPDEDLDNTTMGRNWAEKIIRNLREHDLQWGLLTNGEKWRIYHLDEPTPYETYLEIDLAAILADQASKAFGIFHKFLQAENFVTSDNEESRFDLFKAESQAKIDYIEEELANALKQKEEGGQGVLSSLCMGYVEYLREREDPDFDEEDFRHKIYHGGMLYMFRMLFLFYAEARDLLNDQNKVKLEHIRTSSREYQIKGNANNNSFSLWEELETIFVDIDQTYNGGLFNPYESEFTQFIEENRIADAYMCTAIYHMVYYREKNGEEHRISYRDMSVRHLGTLYEGLLEHKLFIAYEDSEVKVTSNRVEFIPLSEGGKIISGHFVPAGNIYFGSDPTERKTSGSYYTPEVIVDFMIKETVGKTLIRRFESFTLEQKDLLESLELAINYRERVGIEKLIEGALSDFVYSKVLSMSVLDPAMGSGHFLINATNHISNFISDVLNKFPITGEIETDASIWRRRVVENCIYGVDINPLAVELAKLSHWILAMAKNQPLSFLNHHLKCGNSLLWTRLKDVGTYPKIQSNKNKTRQTSYFDNKQEFLLDVQRATEKYRQIETLDSFTRNATTRKSDWLDDIDMILTPYKAICDFHISTSQEDSIDEVSYLNALDNEIFAYPSNKHENSFHWELEFPDVLILSNGFDVVVTNPPYLGESGNKSTFDIVKHGSLRDYFLGKMDLLYFFYHLALDLTKENALISLITTNYFVTADGALKLRADLKKRSTLLKILNFNELKIFNSAQGQHNLIAVLVKGLNSSIIAQTCVTKQAGASSPKMIRNILLGKDKETIYRDIYQQELYESNENYIRFGETESVEGITRKILQKGQNLSNFCNVSQGIVTGANSVNNRILRIYNIDAKLRDGIFILSDNELKRLNPTNNELQILKPWFKNSDINRWTVNNKPKGWLVNLVYTNRPNLEEYPNIKNHISKYKEVLSNRPQTGTLSSAFNNGYWYVLTTSRKIDFDGPKIAAPQRSPINKFGYCENPWYAASDVYFITEKDKDISLKYILALLNSKLMYFWLYYKGKRKGETLELFGTPLSNIPIVKLSMSRQKDFITIVEKIIETSNKDKIIEYENILNDMVYQIYGISDNEKDIIEQKWLS